MKRFDIDTALEIIRDNRDSSDLMLAKAFQEYYWELNNKRELLKAVFAMRDTHTQAQIAKHLGVSQATVSKAMNGKLI